MLESLFNKAAGLKFCNLINKRLPHRCFPVNIAKFWKTAFSQNTSGGCFCTCQEKKFSSILLLRTPIRSSPSEVMLWKGVLKICSKFTGEDPCRSKILMLQNNFTEITLRHGRSPLNLFHIFITRFPKNTWKAASDKWNQEWAYAVYGSGFSD